MMIQIFNNESFNNQPSNSNNNSYNSNINKSSPKTKIQTQNNYRKRQKNIIIVGDSVVKDVENYNVELKCNLNQKKNTFTGKFNSATTDDMTYHVVPMLKQNPETFIIHVGTNDLCTKKSPEMIGRRNN